MTKTSDIDSQDVSDNPTEPSSDMDPLTDADLLTEILRAFVTCPLDIRVEENRDNDNHSSTLMIHVNPKDVGIVIGRDHSTIQAIRHIFSRVAVANQSRTYVHIAGEAEAQQNFRPNNRQNRPDYGYQERPSNQNYMSQNRRPDYYPNQSNHHQGYPNYPNDNHQNGNGDRPYRQDQSFERPQRSYKQSRRNGPSRPY